MDPLARAQELANLRADVLAGGSARLPRPVVHESWKRSLEADVDPGATNAPQVLDDARVATIRGDHPLAAAIPLLRDTLVSIADEATHVMVVTDERGVVLWREGNLGVLRDADRIGLVEGSQWAEDLVGTNAMGTALVTGSPVQIHSAEHLLERFDPWTCAASPVRDPATGQVIGTVDVTGPARSFHPATLALVTATTRLAENHLAVLAARGQRRLDEPARVTLLAPTPPFLHLGGVNRTLTARHAEILATLALNPHGLAADDLALALHGDHGRAVTVRAEVHRLRAVLGTDLVTTKPYQLGAHVRADVVEVRAALARGEVLEAARRYTGPLLPHSDAPAVREEREWLAARIRLAVLAHGDLEALWALFNSADGTHDQELTELLLRTVDHRDPRRALLVPDQQTAC